MQITKRHAIRIHLIAVLLVLCCGFAAASPLALPGIIARAVATQDVRVATPSDGATVEGTTSVVVEFALETGRTPAKVELYVDTELYATNPVRGTVGGSSRTIFYLDTTRFGNGEHSLSAVVYDADNATWYALSGVNIANVDPAQLTVKSGVGVDTLDPTVQIVRPGDGGVLTGIVDILVAAGDEAGNPMVTILVDRKPKAITNRPPYSWSWDTRLYPDGQHIIEAWARDAAQNRAIASPISVEVDNANPLTGAEDILDPGMVTEEAVISETEIASAFVPLAVTGPPVVASVQAISQGYRLAPGSEAVATAIAPPIGSAPSVVAAVVPAVADEPHVATPMLTSPVRAAYQGLASERSSQTPTAVGAGPCSVAPVTITEPLVVATTSVGVNADRAIAPAVGAKTSSVGKPVSTKPKTTVNKSGKSAQPAKSSGPTKSGVQMASAKVAPVMTGRVVGTTGPRNLDSLFIVFDSKTVNFDVKPTIREGMAVAPFRQLFEQTGGKIEWNHNLKIVNAKNEKVDIEIKIGRNMALVNESELTMALTPYLQSGRTMVPLSFIRDALKLKMDYDPSTGRVTLSSQ